MTGYTISQEGCHMLLPQHHQIALELQRLESETGTGLPATSRKWRWLPSRRTRMQDEFVGTGMPMYDQYR